MRVYVIACQEVLRRRGLLKPGLSGAEADALVTALDLQDDALKLAADLMDPDNRQVVATPAPCPQCAGGGLSKAVELVLRLQIPPVFRQLQIHQTNDCACSS